MYPESRLRKMELPKEAVEGLVEEQNYDVLVSELCWWWLRNGCSWRGAREAFHSGSLGGSLGVMTRKDVATFIEAVDTNLLAMEEACRRDW